MTASLHFRQHIFYPCHTTRHHLKNSGAAEIVGTLSEGMTFSRHEPLFVPLVPLPDVLPDVPFEPLPDILLDPLLESLPDMLLEPLLELLFDVPLDPLTPVPDDVPVP